MKSKTMIWPNRQTLLSLYFGLFLYVNPSASETALTPAFHHINVGGGSGFTYEPDTTYANIGEVIIFTFLPTNHSVVRGEYTGSSACGRGGCNPCVPYNLIHPDQEGFDSGNILTQSLPSNANGITFNITINSTSPIWFYCTAIASCHPNGMVGVINPANGTSIIKQRQAAVNAPFQLLPGEPWPAESTPGSESGALPSPSSTFTVNGVPDTHHLSQGAIAGIVMGSLFVAVLATLFFFIGRSKLYKEIASRRILVAHSTDPPSSEMQGPGTEVSPSTELGVTWSPVPQSGVNYNPTYRIDDEKMLPMGHSAFGPSSIQATPHELLGEIPEMPAE